MSGWGEQKQTYDTAKMASSERDEMGFLVFNQYKDDLASVLVSSLPTLALRAASKKLIANAADAAANRFGQTTTQKDRAISLIDVLMKMMDKNMDSAAGVMKHFLDSIEESKIIYDFLRGKYEDEKKNKTKQPEMVVLTNHQSEIVENLEFVLETVSNKLFSCGVITFEQHKVFVDPAARHEQLAIYKVLTEIGESIKVNKQNFDVFVEDVLESIGGSGPETLAKRMKNSLNEDERQQDIL